MGKEEVKLSLFADDMMGFPCGLAGKESTCNAGHLGLVPGLGRSPGDFMCRVISVLLEETV